MASRTGSWRRYYQFPVAATRVRSFRSQSRRSIGDANLISCAAQRRRAWPGIVSRRRYLFRCHSVRQRRERQCQRQHPEKSGVPDRAEITVEKPAFSIFPLLLPFLIALFFHSLYSRAPFSSPPPRCHSTGRDGESNEGANDATGIFRRSKDVTSTEVTLMADT